MEGPGFILRNTYNNRFDDFKEKYAIPSDLMDEFRKFLETKDIKIDEKEYTKDLDFLQARLKAQIAQMIFGLEGYIGVMIEVDTQVQKALSLFPEATKIARLN